MGGGGSPSPPPADPPPPEYAARGATTMEQAQLMAQQDEANQNAALQQQIADQQEAQAQEQLQYQQSQDAAAKAEADQQAAVQAQYDQQRNQIQSDATDWVNNTFGKYDDKYYNQYAQDYTNALTPEVDKQYSQAQSQMLFGLARTGNLNSQAHADLQGSLDQSRGEAYANIATQASNAAATLRQQVGQQQQSLMAQILSTGALGQPTAPQSLDEVNGQIDSTNRAINDIQVTGQDQLASIGQLPNSSTLGNIFGSTATSIGNFLSGNQAFNVANASNTSPVGGAAQTGTSGAGQGPNAQPV